MAEQFLYRVRAISGEPRGEGMLEGATSSTRPAYGKPSEVRARDPSTVLRFRGLENLFTLQRDFQHAPILPPNILIAASSTSTSSHLRFRISPSRSPVLIATSQGLRNRENSAEAAFPSASESERICELSSCRNFTPLTRFLPKNNCQCSAMLNTCFSVALHD